MCRFLYVLSFSVADIRDIASIRRLDEAIEREDFSMSPKLESSSKLLEEIRKDPMKVSNRSIPVPADCIERIYRSSGPKEGTARHKALEEKIGFSYRTVLGELIYAMMTCRPDIAYSDTTLSKFSTSPSIHHYRLLQTIGKYLQPNIDWGIRFKRPTPLSIKDSEYEDEANLKTGGFSRAKSYLISKIPSLEPVFDIDFDTPVLHGFVGASHASDLRKRRSITVTGVVFPLCGGAIVYKSKTLSITAGGSTEAKFIVAHTAGKLTRYLRMVLKELGHCRCMMGHYQHYTT